MCLRAHGEIECLDRHAHPRRLYRAFALRKQNHWILQNVSMESKCPDKIHVQDGVNPYILRMLEGILSLDAAHIKMVTRYLVR